VEVFLKDCHSVINVKDNQQKTPLHIVCETKNLYALEYFMKINNLQLNDQDANGKTPLHYLCFRPWQTECVNKFLNLPGIKFDTVDFENNSALHCMINSMYVRNNYQFGTYEYRSIIESFLSQNRFILFIKNIQNNTIEDELLLQLNQAKLFGHEETIQKLQSIYVFIQETMLSMRVGFFNTEWSFPEYNNYLKKDTKKEL
jgi:ankyrin repeat protein